MKLLTNRLVIMIAVALALAAGSMAFFPAAARPQAAPAALPDPASVVGSGVTPAGYANQLITQFKAQLSEQPENDSARAQLGLAYLQKARETNDPTFYTQAESQFSKALTVNAQNFNAMGGMGSLQLSRHQFRDALIWGQKAAALNPHKAFAYGVIGDAQIELGQYDAAVETFQRMVDLRPDLSSYSRVSYARELYGDTDGAIEAMRQAVTAGGAAAENIAWTQVQLGNLLFGVGRIAEAETAYNAALLAYPGYLHAQAGLAGVRAAQGRMSDAVDLYTQAVATAPLPQYVAALGDLYAAMGDDASARKQYDLVAYTFHVFEVNGVDVNMEKGAFLADQDQDSAEAVRLTQAAAAWRQDIHTQDAVAWALYRANRPAEALTAANSALRLGTQNALLYFHRGMIYHALGDAAHARADLQRALDLNPHFSLKYAPHAAALLKQLAP
jgi:tetratricopeptide (TPR) repeat protein